MIQQEKSGLWVLKLLATRFVKQQKLKVGSNRNGDSLPPSVFCGRRHELCIRFKLHLRSRRSKESESLLSGVTDHIPPLPLNKTVVEVFADFLEYLFKCSSRYIQQSHANGEELWRSFGDNIDFVLSHPNGWEGAEQSQMRQAAILARLVPDTPTGRARVLFVTEGEASLHFALRNNILAEDLKVFIASKQ